MKSLSDLNDQRVALSLSVKGRSVLLAGVASYGQDDDLGPVLRVHIENEAGPLEIVIQQSQWDGSIVRTADLGCDYLIQLSEDCVSLL